MKKMMSSWIGTWKVKKKLIAAVIVVSALVGVVGAVGGQQLARVQQGTKKIQLHMMERIQAEKDYLLTRDPKFLEVHKRAKDAMESAIKTSLKETEKERDKRVSAALERIRKKNDKYEQTFQEVVDLVRAHLIAGAISLSSTKSNPAAEEVMQEIRALIERDGETR